MPSAKRIVGFNPFPFESFVANRVRKSIKGPCSIFPIHKKYGGAVKYTWVHARGASIPGRNLTPALYVSLDSTDSAVGR